MIVLINSAQGYLGGVHCRLAWFGLTLFHGQETEQPPSQPGRVSVPQATGHPMHGQPPISGHVSVPQAMGCSMNNTHKPSELSGRKVTSLL